MFSYIGGKFNLEQRAKVWAVKYGFRRPINEQHLDGYKTFLRLSTDYFKWGTFLFLSLISTGILLGSLISLLINDFLSFNIYFFALLFFGMLAIWGCFFADQATIFLAYRRELQSITHGSARWALPEDLMPGGYLHLATKIPENFITLGRFFRKYVVGLALEVFCSHITVIAPPRAGKSSTVVMPILRQFATKGGAVVLDPKGELYNYTAGYYGNVYRFDLEKPEFSDFFDLFGMCRRNTTLAGQVAFYLMNDSNGSAPKNPIWDESANSMLGCMILHLCEFIEFPQPADIFKFMADFPAKSKKRINQTTGKEEFYVPLNETMISSPNSDVREIWGSNFGQLAKETFTSVTFTMLSKLAVFRDKKIRHAMRPVTPEEAAKGRRKIDFTQLRKMYQGKDGVKRGTGIYMVIPIAEAERLKRVIACFVAVAAQVLTSTGGDEQKVHSILMLDEVGNIPIPGLQELVNIGRSMKICVFLSYQNKSQPENHFGIPTAKAILESMGTLAFLPGLKGDNAEFASSLIGTTTIYQTSSRDARGDSMDSENKTEHSRRLIMPDEIRRMGWFQEMLIVIADQLPIRTNFNEDAKKTDPTRVFPNPFSEAPQDEDRKFQVALERLTEAMPEMSQFREFDENVSQLPVEFSEVKLIPVEDEDEDVIVNREDLFAPESNVEVYQEDDNFIVGVNKWQ